MVRLCRRVQNRGPARPQRAGPVAAPEAIGSASASASSSRHWRQDTIQSQCSKSLNLFRILRGNTAGDCWPGKWSKVFRGEIPPRARHHESAVHMAITLQCSIVELLMPASFVSGARLPSRAHARTLNLIKSRVRLSPTAGLASVSCWVRMPPLCRRMNLSFGKWSFARFV